jgi:hypothetical protein
MNEDNKDNNYLAIETGVSLAGLESKLPQIVTIGKKKKKVLLNYVIEDQAEFLMRTGRRGLPAKAYLPLENYVATKDKPVVDPNTIVYSCSGQLERELHMWRI